MSEVTKMFFIQIFIDLSIVAAGIAVLWNFSRFSDRLSNMFVWFKGPISAKLFRIAQKVEAGIIAALLMCVGIARLVIDLGIWK